MQSMSNRPTPASRSREFDHKAAPQSNAVSDGLVEWLKGVKERTLHPLEAAAKASQKIIGKPAEELAMDWSNPVAGGMAGTIGKVGKGVAETQYELAHEVAQRNAAKPISEGGLGLPADNMPLDRAKAMGFDTPAYHGTTANFNEFKLDKIGRFDSGYKGKGVNVSEYPDIASNYAKDKYGMTNPHTGSVMPLMIKKGKNFDYGNSSIKDSGVIGKDIIPSGATDDSFSLFKVQKSPEHINNSVSASDFIRKYGPEEYSNALKKLGYESSSDGKMETLIFNPANIRSRFAAFDPARRNEADILGNIDPQLLKIIAGGSGAGLLGAGGYSALQDNGN